MTPRLCALACLALLLAGCGSQSVTAPPPPVSVSARPAPPPIFRPPPAGDPVLGKSAAAVGALLGTPRLDVKEGPGRKLQFIGAGCVIDIYFYAPRAGGDPVATHIDARGQDGRDADRGYCLEALKTR